MTNIFAIINEHKLHLDDIIRKTPNRKINGNRKLPIKIYPDKFFGSEDDFLVKKTSGHLRNEN